jgi:hypothetical protein
MQREIDDLRRQLRQANVAAKVSKEQPNSLIRPYDISSSSSLSTPPLTSTKGQNLGDHSISGDTLQDLYQM